MNTTTQTSEFYELIDRKLFFGNPEILGAQISPDGQFIAFIKPFNDVRNIWVKRRAEPFENSRLLTNESLRPVPGFFWSRDSRFILYLKDENGNENFNVFAVDPNAVPVDGELCPGAINLTNSAEVQTQIYSLPKSEPDFIYIGANERDRSWHDLYKVQISTGKKTLVWQNTDRLTRFVFDNKGEFRIAMRANESGETEMLRFDGREFVKIYSCGVFETCDPVRFHKEDKLLYIRTNKGERDLMQLVLFDPETAREISFEQDPESRVDLKDAGFSEATDELIYTTYEDDKVRRYWKNPDFEKDYAWLSENLSGKQIEITSISRDDNLWTVVAASDIEPGETYLFDRNRRVLDLQYRIREKLPRELLSTMKPIRYASSDGLEIPGYLTLPNGSTPVELPLIVVPHGGPWYRDVCGYNAFAQFLSNRGYAVLQMNFRGSTGFGKNFIDAGNKEWGGLMQDDITWGVKHLIEKGIADANRVGIIGGSYGGYATLAAVTFTPDLFSAAVAIVAPSNLITLLNSIPPYWESYRYIFLERMGDPGTPEGKERLERQSPLNFVDKIKTPLMIVQGANDPRVKQSESDQIVVALRERNYPVVYILAEDEGHGFQRPVNSLATYAEAEKFFAEHLGGKFQKEMEPEVEARLAELKVDISKVKMPTFS